MNLKSFIEHGKIDWTNAYFRPDFGTGFHSPFALKPEDFVTFAKADFFKADSRGLVNGLSNAKRAIDCQADSFISAIGLDPEKLDKQLGSYGIASLSFGNQSVDGPVKLRFLQALGVATPGIVTRMRRLRNLLEHEYKKPRKADVRDAIGVAELFVQACDGKMKSMMNSFAFGSGLTKARGNEQVAKEFYVHFETQPKLQIEVRFWDHDWIAINGTAKSPSVKIAPREEGFIPLMKLVWHADWDRDMTEPFKAFLTELGIPISITRFRIREWNS